MMKSAHVRALRVVDRVFMIVLLHILSLLLAWGDDSVDVSTFVDGGAGALEDADGVRPR